MIKEYQLVYDGNIVSLKETRNFNEDYTLKENDLDFISDFFNEHYNCSFLAVEHLYCIALDITNKIIGITLISVGDCKSCSLNIRNITTFLTVINANKFIILHNHPYGNLVEPSIDDLNSYNICVQLSKFIDVELMHDIIIGFLGYYDVVTKLHNRIGDDEQ